MTTTTTETRRPVDEAELAYEQELLIGGVTDVLNAIVESLGITQKELAIRIGVTEGRVSQILSGSRALTLSTLAAFGRAAGVRFDLLPRAVEDTEELDWLNRFRDVVVESRPAGGAAEASGRRPSKRALARNEVRPNARAKKGGKPMARNQRHVVPNPEGGWDIRAPQADRSSGHFDRQTDAVNRAREIVRNSGGGEIVIHDKGGRVRDSDTVPPGRDPNPPRDTR